MIYIVDNFIEDIYFKLVKSQLTDFKEDKTPGKSFWVMPAHKDFIKYVTNKLTELEGKEIDVILSFFRQASLKEDNTWRIHNDSIIDNQQPDRAIVLYMSDNETDDLNGTAFWEHKELGDKYINKSKEDFDKLLTKDSEDLSKWNVRSVIGHKPNRLISYPCNYFHSKYPARFIKPRKVFVMFYKIK